MKISGWVHGLALLLLALPAIAQGPAHLVADLAPGTAAFDPDDTHIFNSYTAVNGRVIFFAFFPAGGSPAFLSQCGLWEVDVATGAAEILANVCAEDDLIDVYPRMIAATGAVAFFSDTSGRLWRTDGTAGTFPLRGVKVRPTFSGEGPPVLGPDGRTLFFAGCTPATGCEPWVSDGTRQGTRPLADLRPGPASSNPATFTVDGSRVLFAAGGEVWSAGGAAASPALLARLPATTIQALLPRGPAVYVLAGQASLYRLDRTTGRVRLLRSFSFDPRQGPGRLQAVGGRVLFAGNDPEAEVYQLWQADGERVRPIGPPGFSSGSERLYAVGGGRVVFSAAVRDAFEQRLWVLDPGTKKPRLLQGCAEGCPAMIDYLDSAVVLAGRLYFTGHDARHGYELWSTDGTAQGTRRVADLYPGACDGGPLQLGVALGRLVVVDARRDVWASDGTPAGTVRLATIGPGLSPFLPPDLAILGGRIVFTGIDPVAGVQPFASDLTPAGTAAIATLGETLAASSRPSSLAPLGRKVLLAACEGGSGSLWASDGTPAGTVPLPETEGLCDPFLFFTFFHPAGSFALFDLKGRIWRTDGTPAGTAPLVDLPVGVPFIRTSAPLGDGLFFLLDPETFPPVPTQEWSFWTSDGTPAGTRTAFRFHFGGTPSPFAAVGGLIFFEAQSPESPFPIQIWRTDGTEEGTLPLLDEAGEGRLEIAQLGGKIYFVANARGAAGRELWSTDGTAGGTAPVLPVAEGERPRNPTSLISFQGALYFLAKTGLWRSDGTAAGTRLLRAFAPLADGEPPSRLTPAGGQLFFRADDGVRGAELWKTDGTPEGTALVRDIVPGPRTSHPGELTAAGGRVYFGALDDEHGYELWQSDGTAAGTQLVQDILPGPASSNPQQLTAAEGTLYFTANDGAHGRELWAVPMP
jgi:ELWxxDGT repeat protein